MKNQSLDISELVSIVRNVAIEELLPRFAKVKQNKKCDGSILTEADLAVQTKIEKKLKQLDSSILFLAEEMTEQAQETILQQSGRPVWVLDPLDGTTNFAAGIPYYAVSLALIEKGQPVLAIVYDPERDECFIAEKGSGAKLNQSNIEKGHSKIKLSNAVACIDLKRLPEKLAIKIVSQHPFRSQRSFGGVALDWCWLAAGRFDVYLHGKQNIWDYAAGYLIYSEAGGISTTLSGEPIFVQSLQPRSGVAALDKDLFIEWTDWLEINIAH
ncbi:MAG: inositol monophosphatase [Gammaproteobacteria bacterium]|nr:inositol monophosphatase [Gammaproteobacteria bacterium]MCW8988591.1 inositol monophosphatase [Gammaproteobacteria bacterium]